MSSATQTEVQPQPPKPGVLSWVAAIALFAAGAAVQYAFYTNLPPMSSEHKDAIRVPRSLEDLKLLESVLSHYMDDHGEYVYMFFVAAFLYLQMFALPGSAFLAILSGALFDSRVALATICIGAAFGSTICYTISWGLAGSLVNRYLGDRIAAAHAQMNAQHNDLFSFILFLRITPFLPNWFISIASPHLGIPVWAYFLGTLIGMAPLTLLHIQAGLALQELSSMKELSILNPRNLAMVIGLGFLSLVPIFWRRSQSTSTTEENKKKN